jgi:hypothetical protein
VTTEGRVTIYRQPVQPLLDGIGDDSTIQIGLGGKLLGTSLPTEKKE